MTEQKERLLQELLQLHQDILKTQTTTLDRLQQYVGVLADAVVACIQMDTEIMARVVLLERSVVYKELPDG